VFNRFQLDQYFSHKISGENFPKSKPDPAIFLHAAEIAKSEHDECIVIEDSTNGVEAAFCANLYCLGYKSVNSKKQNLEKANSIVDDFKQINAVYIIDLK
jgi:beta-phosphoglucomutase-like phosphatase (HAD superfamily)